jgi:surface protein
MTDIIYKKGWNLIGFIQNKTLDEIKEYFQGNYIENTLYKYEVGKGYQIITDYVEVNNGYWIKLSNDIIIQTDDFINSTSSFQYKKGWNLVSFIKSISLDELKEYFQGNYIENTLYRYDSGYQVITDKVEEHIGYWIKLKNDILLQPLVNIIKAPVITITGDATVTLEVKSTYIDAGATANDSNVGNLTSSIVTVNPVDTDVVGEYTVTYNVSDAAGNAATEVVRTVKVVDTTPPIITLIDPEYNYTGSVQIFKVPLGIKSINIDAYGAGGGGVSKSGESKGGKRGRVKGKINVENINTLYIYVGSAGGQPTGGYNGGGNGFGQLEGSAYNLASGGGGATHIATVSGLLSELKNSAVEDTDDDGNYTEKSGNPVLIVAGAGGGGYWYQSTVGGNGGGLVGGNGNASGGGGGYEDWQMKGGTQIRGQQTDARGLKREGILARRGKFGQGGNGWSVYDRRSIGGGSGWFGGEASWSDGLSGAGGSSYTHPILCSEVTHIQGDGYGNGKLIISYNLKEIFIDIGTTYIDPGATAYDTYDGDISDKIVISGDDVNTDIIGTYTVKYDVSDAAGNKATATRTVNVVDTTAPVITITGTNPVTVELGSTYTDDGATATDASGPVTVTSSGTVDINKVGEYTITYKVSDASGNEATATRIVNVKSTKLNDNNIKTIVNKWISTPSHIYFTDSSNLTYYGHISNWDVSNVTNMSELFRDKQTFNDDISSWDVSNVTNMSYMFRNARSFNQNISSWDVSNVKDMSYMFRDAKAFNQNINNWDVSNVTSFNYMFAMKNYNHPLNKWVTNSVKNMSKMFSETGTFNQSINEWDVSNVTDMSEMFSYNDSFNQPLNSWNVSSVVNMSRMFSNSIFNQNINNWTITSVKNMGSMFSYTSEYNQPLDSWDVSNVTDMSNMFSGSEMFNQSINDWNVSSVININGMFYGCVDFNQPLNSWNVSSVTDMADMFQGTKFNQSINDWDVSKVKNMSGMFAFTKVFNQSLNKWNVGSVTNMQNMFYESNGFNQNIGMWNVSNVTDMFGMFYNVSVFNQDLSSWCVENIDSKPLYFDRDTEDIWTLPKPNWGSSC